MKTLALLLDPDKVVLDQNWLSAIKSSSPNFILVGGSQSFPYEKLDVMVQSLKAEVDIPIIGFPGDTSQIHYDFDALLALSVLQSTDTQFVLDPLIEVAKDLAENDIRTFFTPYILLNSSGNTSVERILKNKVKQISSLNTFEKYLSAISILNANVLYLEAGSGAEKPISNQWINMSKAILPDVFHFVGGGIRTVNQAESIWKSGANCLVIGNAVEQNLEFLKEICDLRNFINDSRIIPQN